MKTQNTFSQLVVSFLIVAVFIAFGKLYQPAFAQTISVPDDATTAKSSQMVLQNNIAPTIPNGDLSITGIANPNFENGKTDWVEYSSHGWDLILNSGFPGTVTPHSGSWAAWLGGDFNDVSYIQQQVTVPVGGSTLSYWHWIASLETECGYDKVRVNINSTTVDEYNLCTTNNTGGWVVHTVDLSSYIGQSVPLQIRVETDSALNSNLFIDDVYLGFYPVYLPILINQ